MNEMGTRGVVASAVTFQDKLAAIRIPEGYGPGDLIVLEISGDQVLVEGRVLETLVRAYHQYDGGGRRATCYERAARVGGSRRGGRTRGSGVACTRPTSGSRSTRPWPVGRRLDLVLVDVMPFTIAYVWQRLRHLNVRAVRYVVPL